MVFQPFDDCWSLYDALVQALGDERLTELSVVVAWAKESGLQRIRPNLQAFRARGSKARILLGIDADGATFEGLYAAIDDFNEARVLFNAKSRTFHPKLYMFTGKTASVVIIGSGNLTKGGLLSNYEAGMCLELDLGDAADAQKHKAFTDYIKRLQDDGTTRVLDKDLIQQLPDYFHIGSEAHPAKSGAGGDSSGISEKRKDPAQLFGASHHKMKPDVLKHPATKSAKTPGSDTPVGTEGSLENVQSTVDDTSARAAITLLGERKSGRSFLLPLPDGGVGQVPCEAVPDLIFWCWDTAKGPHARASFKVEARKRGVLAVAQWSADHQYIGLNPEKQRGKYSPHKPEIADHLLGKLSQALIEIFKSLAITGACHSEISMNDIHFDAIDSTADLGTYLRTLRSRNRKTLHEVSRDTGIDASALWLEARAAAVVVRPVVSDALKGSGCVLLPLTGPP